MTRMAIVDRAGTVHDLSHGSCEEVQHTRGEFSLAGPRYVSVSATQVKVWKLPGCSECFGTLKAFQDYIDKKYTRS